MRKLTKAMAELCLALAVAGAGAMTGTAHAGPIPTSPALYWGPLQGTASGNPFARYAYLLVEPTLVAAGGVNFNNGPNPRDVFLFSGNPTGAPSPGAIWFATNTTIFQQLGIYTYGLTGLDTVYMTADETAGVLNMTVDGQFAILANSRSALLNTFNVSGGVAAEFYQIVQGTMKLVFSSDGKTVTGNIGFTGFGLITPEPSTYLAHFSGTRIQ